MPRYIPYDDRAPVDLAYIRVSTDDQSLGMEVQRTALLTAQPNATIFEDEGISGATMERPELKHALKLLAQGSARSLTVYRLDRLSRSVLHFAEIVEAATAQGWRLRVQDCPELDPSSPFGEAMLSMLAVFAQLERRLISQRTKDGLAQRRAEGVRLGRAPAVPDEVREKIRELRDREELTFGAIADRLNARGVPTAQGAPCWTASTVRAAALYQPARIPAVG